MATGLAELDGDFLAQVETVFHLVPPAAPIPGGFVYYEDEEERKKKATELMLVGCRLAKLEPEDPAVFSATAAHLAKVEEYLGVPFDQFFTWFPSERDLEWFNFRVKHAGSQKTRDAILKSIDSNAVQLICPPPVDNTPKSLADAIQRIKSLQSRRNRDPEEERGAWGDLQQMIQKDSISPLQKAAAKSIDPIERNYWGLAVMNGQLLFPQFSRLIANSTTEGKRGILGRPIALPDEEFRQVMQLVDRQQKILKNLADYQKNPFRRWK